MHLTDNFMYSRQFFCGASARIPIMPSSFTKFRNNTQTQHTR